MLSLGSCVLELLVGSRLQLYQIHFGGRLASSESLGPLTVFQRLGTDNVTSMTSLK